MKKELNQLKKLGQQVASIGKEVKMELNKHNQLRAIRENKYNKPLVVSSEEEEINMYFGDDYETWSFKIGTSILREVEIKGYSESISIPWSLTAKELKIIIQDVSEFVELLKASKDVLKKTYKLDNAAKIEELKAEIKQLEV
jgi:hypothetical protein